MDLEPVIGLEVHAQLLTVSKMFCACSADYAGAPANTHVCPVCLGMPGALPAINALAVEYTIRTALAFHCEIPEFSKFDRKNYHYPDLMKGYQISQFDFPLSRNGYILIEDAGVIKTIRVRRVHLEEDTAKLAHVDGASLVDVNRGGVPLMEIVSEPDMHSVEEARLYSLKLRQILRYLGVSSGDMEKGAMRFEANISLRPSGSLLLSDTRVEIKNLNSLRAMVHATEFEIARQKKIWDSGGKVDQETMGWDEGRNVTITQRSKEEAHDYRYFPEPDLPSLHISDAQVDGIRASLPELPDERRERLTKAFGLSSYEAGVITAEKEIAEYYDRAVKSPPLPSPPRGGVAGHADPKAIANWVTGEMFRLMKETSTDIAAVKIAPAQIGELAALVQAGAITSTMAKQVFEEMFATGKSPQAIVDEKGFAVIGDAGMLEPIIAQVMEANAGAVDNFRAGKETALKFLVGQVMRASKGQANPNLAADLLKKKIGTSSWHS